MDNTILIFIILAVIVPVGLYAFREFGNLLAKTGSKKIHKVIEKGDLTALQEILNEGAKIDKQDGFGQTGVYLASDRGNMQILKYLVEKGAAIDTVAGNGTFPLLIAASKGYWDIVKYLIDNGADIDQQSPGGATALHAMVLSKQDSAVKKLLEFGANPNTYGPYQRTPLVDVLWSDSDYEPELERRMKVAKELIKAGADINMPEPDGKRSPLHVAAIKGTPSMIQYLLDNGADKYAKDSNGRAPIKYANSSVANLLSF